MFDASLRKYIDRPLNYVTKYFVACHINADMVSFFALIPALLAFIFILQGWWLWALIMILCNRLCDGLDGAIARQTQTTDRGAFLDIVLDFIFYSSVPLAFALHNPEENALPAAVLIYSFVGTASSFLAYAIIAEKKGITTDIRGKKGFYYIGGLTEGFETILLFVLCCLLPDYFALFAYIYAGLCGITTVSRIVAGYQNFKS
jgi:phosphatidylglycerophosphate synthase